MFIRAMFAYFLATKIFTGIILIFSIVVLIIFNRKKTISVKYFYDSGRPSSFQAQMDWWNFFRHPLTVNAESRLIRTKPGRGNTLR